ncbi:MAG TPA: acyltransferase [Chitinophagaceae bacterium]|nr:acyltransferase [Chitinophagaceae bacterium]
MKLSRWLRYFFLVAPNFILKRVLPKISHFRFFNETANTQTPITFDIWYHQFVEGKNTAAYWPIHPTSTVSNPKNIYCGIETCPGYSPGNYIQAIGKIYIGDYTQIAPNVGIISANHDLYDNSKHIIKDVYIGKYCWLGMGCIILPGVVLGDYTIVAAGAVVTKSFEEGYCIIGGNPAKKIKTLEKERCIFHRSSFEYNGYIPHIQFDAYRKKYLEV